MARRTAAILAIILLVGFVLRLSGAVWWQARYEGRFAFPDSESYWELARTIAHGEPYEFGPDRAKVFRMPGYPALLAPLFLICGGDPPVFLARVESALLGVATLAALFWLARSLWDDRVGLMAAAMAAVYPGAVAIDSLVLSESPFCLLMILQLGFWVRSGRAESKKARVALAAAAGLLAGAATLVRPSWLLFVPFAAAVSIVLGDRRRLQTGIALVVLGFQIAAMTPWWIRNYEATGIFVPTTLQMGASLYDGLNPNATGASDMRFVEEFTARAKHEAEPSETLEARLDGQFRCGAVDWATQHPGDALRLAAVKLGRFWSPWPNDSSFSAWWMKIPIIFAFLPIAILGIMGACRTYCQGWLYRVCWLPAIYLSLMHMVFVSSIRYREPAMLALMTPAAAWVALRFFGARTSTKEGRPPSSAT